MCKKLMFLVSLIVLLGLTQSTSALITETFDSDLGKWADLAYQNTNGDNNFGWSNTNNAGGASAGEAGGTFGRHTWAYIGDEFDEELTSADTIQMRGTAKMIDNAAKGHWFIGFFYYDSGNPGGGGPKLGIDIVEPDNPGFPWRLYLSINGDKDQAPQILVNDNTVWTFDLTYENGTFSGTIAGQNVSRSVVLSGTINAMGMGTFHIATEAGEYGDLYVDDVQYTTPAPPVPTIQFESAASGDLETVTPAELNVILTNPEEGWTYTVDYAAVGGTATAGVDYIMAGGGPACWDYPTQCHGDSDATGDVKGSDFLALKNSWYKCYPDADYDPCADLELSNPTTTGSEVVLGELNQHTYTIIDPSNWDIDLSIDIALPVWTGTENVPDWEGVPIPATLKDGWIPWCARKWRDMYGQGTVAMENVAGTGISTMVSTVYGGLTAVKVCGMCMPRLNGGTPYGSPDHDPICNSWLQVEDHPENPSGDIIMALYNLPSGEYELYSYHNNFECHRGGSTPEGTEACCDLIANPQPPMPSITALSINLIKFRTDGSAVFVVYESGCCVSDGIRPHRVGGRAILNAFRLRLIKPGPSPGDGVMDVPTDTILKWPPVAGALQHDVYLGTDSLEVFEASDPYTPPGLGRFEGNSYDPEGLEYATTYYWRVDGFDPGNGVTKGSIWSFTTTACNTIDDFETYKDTQAMLSNWEGLGGAQGDISLSTADFAHGDDVSRQKSLALEYHNVDPDNFSEACLTFAGPQDWTGGPATLSIFLRGHTGNYLSDSVRMYVIAEDAYGSSQEVEFKPVNLTEQNWQLWGIHLAKFRNVDLRAVNKLCIGIGDRNGLPTGAQGNVWIDDIGLCIPELNGGTSYGSAMSIVYQSGCCAADGILPSRIGRRAIFNAFELRRICNYRLR